MHHRKTGRKLGRTSAHRKALFRNLVHALIQHERICTTEPKAKELRRVADEMVTLAKRGDLHAWRSAFAVLRSKDTTQKLFKDIAPRFTDTAGGYTHLYKVGTRKGDGAPLAYIEFTKRGKPK
ncbi:MAG: 50S ribosomal protein L17 [bacterium]